MMQKTLPCGELLKRLHDIFETNANKNLQEQDVTFSQMKMLILLEHWPGGSATLKELEKYFGSSQATIAGIASRLEKKGLIEGYTDADDRRIKHVRLSPEGLALCRRTKVFMDRNEQWLLTPLSEEERQEFHRLLQKVYDAIK